MPTKNAASAPWQDLETQAYHAYREWPLWLVLRERELAERGAAGRTDKRAPNPALAAAGTEHKATAQEGATE